MNHKKVYGFFIMEIMLYVALLSLVMLLLFSSFSTVYYNVRMRMDNAECAMHLCALEWLMRRDLVRVFCTEDACIEMDSFYIWQCPDYFVSWQQQGDQLKRSEGVYNSEQHTWLKKTTSTIASAIEQFSIHIHWYHDQKLHKKYVHYLEISLHMKNSAQKIQKHSFMMKPYASESVV